MAESQSYEKLFLLKSKEVQKKYLNKDVQKPQLIDTDLKINVEDKCFESEIMGAMREKEELKRHVRDVIKNTIPNEESSDERFEDETTLDDGLSLFINLYRIYKLSENDKQWHYFENESLIELIIERQKWLKDFLFNFPLIFVTGLYEQNEMEEFWNSLSFIFNNTDAIRYKVNYEQQLDRIFKSIVHVFSDFNKNPN